MLTRLAATCALAVFIASAGYAQDGLPRQDRPSPGGDSPLPRPEALPPPMEGPAPPPIQASPPPPALAPPMQASPPPANLPLATANRCAAVAYTADGAFGAAYGMENCNDAERLAVEECRRESTDKADCSRGVVIRRDTWFHVQFCRLGTDWTTHITTKQTLSEVNRDAAEWARTSKYGAMGCRMVPNGLFHSGGLHTKM